jgi:hypothetical protein
MENDQAAQRRGQRNRNRNRKRMKIMKMFWRQPDSCQNSLAQRFTRHRESKVLGACPFLFSSLRLRDLSHINRHSLVPFRLPVNLGVCVVGTSSEHPANRD